MQQPRYVFGQVREFTKDVEETRTVEFIISNGARDRHNSRLNMDNWKLENFNANPVIGYNHNVYGRDMCVPDNPDNVLGSGKAYVEDGTRSTGGKRLIGQVNFDPADINPLAEKVFRKVLRGSLRATSVGFMEVGKGEIVKEQIDGREVETYQFEGQELLEFSIVNIPSNPEAVGRSLYSNEEFVLGYIMRFMPEEVSIKDVKGMKVQEVFDLVEEKLLGKKKEISSVFDVETMRKENNARNAELVSVLLNDVLTN